MNPEKAGSTESETFSFDGKDMGAYNTPNTLVIGLSMLQLHGGNTPSPALSFTAKKNACTIRSLVRAVCWNVAQLYKSLMPDQAG